MSATRPVAERLWEKVNKNGPIPAHRPELGPCWIWEGSTSGKGYGRFWISPRLRPAHTVAYELVVGPIPDGLEPDHLCRVRSCVNPAHVEPVTHRENTLRADRVAMGAFNTAKTQCPQGHPYDEENTLFDRFGFRKCRECARIWANERYRRIKNGNDRTGSSNAAA